MNYNALSYDRGESGVQPMLFSANEPALYQDDTKTGYFSILIKSGTGSGMKIQTSHPLEHLQFVLSALDPNRDTWISQASFFKKNRRVVNLKSVGLSFLDIDCYRLSWAKGLPPEVMAKHFVAFCEHEGVPAPSLIVFSGRGLQPKWLFEEALPQAALPRWNAVQKALLGKLERYGADPMARDASRVLRLVETINTKSGAYCHVVHQTSGLDGLPIRYNFDAFSDLILPFTREEIRQRRAELAEKALERVQRALERPECILTADSLNWSRLLDLRQLVAMRGGISEGMRMMMLAYQMNFLALSRQVEPSTFFLEAKQVANAIDPTWGFHNSDLSAIIGKFKEALAGKTVFFAGREYSPLYTPKNETLIDLFQITDDEQRQLKTIISSGVKQERNTKIQQRIRREKGVIAREDYEGRADARKERALELYSKGMKKAQIAREIGLDRSTITKYLKSVESVSS